jgi:hypothetical protein
VASPGRIGGFDAAGASPQTPGRTLVSSSHALAFAQWLSHKSRALERSPTRLRKRRRPLGCTPNHRGRRPRSLDKRQRRPSSRTYADSVPGRRRPPLRNEDLDSGRRSPPQGVALPADGTDSASTRDRRGTVVQAFSHAVAAIYRPATPGCGRLGTHREHTRNGRRARAQGEAPASQQRISSWRAGSTDRSLLGWAGRPDALLRPAPLRTGRARFRASGSSRPVKVRWRNAVRSAHEVGASRPRVRSPRRWSRRLTCPLVLASSSSSLRRLT